MTTYPAEAVQCALCDGYLSSADAATLYDEEHDVHLEVHPACLKDYEDDQGRQGLSDHNSAWMQ